MAGSIKVEGKKLDLSKVSTREDGGLTKPEGQARAGKLQEELYEMQELLYAAGTHSLLIVLQGLDTSGKEGAIGSLSKGMNAHGVRVAPFKVPTPIELGHDFLWRVHAQTPEKGMIGIFNRSHYEDVLVVRVHKFVPEEVWKGRYAHIRNFESLLSGSNTLILKFFLHISREEQEERLIAREQDPRKAWKLNVNDWKERRLWGDYQRAYEDALVETSTKFAPWHIVPADQKWYRDLVVCETVLETLRPFRKEWEEKLKDVARGALAEIEEYRRANP